jgi:hypothetical protein
MRKWAVTRLDEVKKRKKQKRRQTLASFSPFILFLVCQKGETGPRGGRSRARVQKLRMRNHRGGISLPEEQEQDLLSSAEAEKARASSSR